MSHFDRNGIFSSSVSIAKRRRGVRPILRCLLRLQPQPNSAMFYPSNPDSTPSDFDIPRLIMSSDLDNTIEMPAFITESVFLSLKRYQKKTLEIAKCWQIFSANLSSAAFLPEWKKLSALYLKFADLMSDNLELWCLTYMIFNEQKSLSKYFESAHN